MSETDTDTPVDESGLIDITPPKPRKDRNPASVRLSEDTAPSPEICKRYELWLMFKKLKALGELQSTTRVISNGEGVLVMPTLKIKPLYELAQLRVSESVSPEEALRQVIREAGISDSGLVNDMVQRNLPHVKTAEQMREEDPSVQAYFRIAAQLGERDP